MKKKILIPLFILLSLILISIAAIIVFEISGYSFSKCRCIRTEDGRYIMVDGHSPIVLNNRSKNDDLFHSLSTGDEILVLHDGIAETYPGSTGAYFIKKLSDGDASNISEDVLYQLVSLGWKIEGCDIEVEKDVLSDIKTPSRIDFSYTFYPAPYDEDTDSISIIRSCDELSLLSINDDLSGYDEAFFEESYLIVIYLVGPSGMTEFSFPDITKEGDTLTITIQEYTPSPHTDDLLTCLAFIKLSRDVDVFDESFVKVCYEELRAFNFTDDVFFNHLDENTPGYRTEGFVNTEPRSGLTIEEIIDLALNEVNFEYNSVNCYYDKNEDMYRIDVSVSEPDEFILGGGSSVYIYSNGVTKAILAWE